MVRPITHAFYVCLNYYYIFWTLFFLSMEMTYNRFTKRSFVLYVALQLRLICLEFARV